MQVPGMGALARVQAPEGASAAAGSAREALGLLPAGVVESVEIPATVAFPRLRPSHVWVRRSPPARARKPSPGLVAVPAPLPVAMLLAAGCRRCSQGDP